jgi:hypothetical protein
LCRPSVISTTKKRTPQRIALRGPPTCSAVGPKALQHLQTNTDYARCAPDPVTTGASKKSAPAPGLRMIDCTHRPQGVTTAPTDPQRPLPSTSATPKLTPLAYPCDPPAIHSRLPASEAFRNTKCDFHPIPINRGADQYPCGRVGCACLGLSSQLLAAPIFRPVRRTCQARVVVGFLGKHLTVS